MTRIFRFVTWPVLEDFLLLGWMVVADLGPTHGEWSCLCEWRCDCRVIEAKKRFVAREDKQVERPDSVTVPSGGA